MNNYQDLTPLEIEACSGGESIWYWLSYAAGATVRALEEDWDRASQPGSYQWSPARPYG